MQVRYSTKSLLIAFSIVAVCCGAIILAGPFWSAILFTAAFLAIMAAIVAAVLSRGQRRAICIGFALLGGGYLYMAMLDAPRQPNSGRWDPWLVTTHLLIRGNEFVERIRPKASTGYPAQEYLITGFPRNIYRLPSNTVSFVRIGHSIIAVVVGLLGGAWGRHCYIRQQALATQLESRQ